MIHVKHDKQSESIPIVKLFRQALFMTVSALSSLNQIFIDVGRTFIRPSAQLYSFNGVRFCWDHVWLCEALRGRLVKGVMHLSLMVEL